MTTTREQYCAAHPRDICRIALRCGELMASHGAEAYRIEDTTLRILRTTGFSYAETHVSVTGLMITLDDPSLERPITLVKRISNRTSDLSQISLTNDISRRFVNGTIDIEQAEKELNALSTVRFYPNWIIYLCTALVGPFFTFMFGGYPMDALASLMIGLITGFITLLLSKIDMPTFLQNLFAALGIGFSFCLFFDVIPIGQHAGPIISGSIMCLVPGLLLTVSIRDLLTGDYMSGMSRMIEATLIALAIASGVSIAIRIAEHSRGVYDLSTPAPFITYGAHWVVPPYIIFQGICSFLSTVGFIVFFNAEPRHLLACGLIGGFTWFCYNLIHNYVPSMAIPTFIAALIASICSFKTARKLRSPVTVFFTGGVFCLVPGAGIFMSMYYFIGYDMVNGPLQLLRTLEVAGLIALAMAIHSVFNNTLQKTLKRRNMH